MTDTLVTYQLWPFRDTTLYSVKKYEVLSFMMDKRTQKSKKFSDKDEDIVYDSNLLGEYKSGEVVTGYVITLKKDTLYGFITIKNVARNQAEILFTDNGGKQTRFTIKDAIAYGYGNINYERVKIRYRKEITNGIKSSDGYHFLHLAVEGPSKLYRFYNLQFSNGTMASYNQDPPLYLGKLKRHFIITNPNGKEIFTKGRTLTGALNRTYYEYPKYLSSYPVNTPRAAELPDIVTGFNAWFEKNK